MHCLCFPLRLWQGSSKRPPPFLPSLSGMSDLESKPFIPLDEKAKDPSRNSVCRCTFFKFKEEPDEKELRILLGQVRRVQGLVELHFGKDEDKMHKGYSHTAAGFTHAMTSRHLNAQHLGVFERHPHFVALSRYLLKFVSETPVVISFVNIPSQL